MPILNKVLKWILRWLRIIFVQPFRWYGKLSFFKKILVGITVCGGLCLIALIFPLLLFFAVSSGMFEKMPDDQELLSIKNYQASEVYTSDSVLIGRYFVENRSDARFEEISPSLVNAIIATEDARFYEHTGIDTKGLMRVLFKSILLRQKTGGGSTLSQQLVKNLFGRKSYGWLTMPVNKIREAIIANQLEKLYSKKEILMLYINTVSFGEDTYGIKTASKRFFNVTPAQLNSEEAAVLAGMLKSPTLYNPRKNPANALKRRNLVLEQMAKYHYLDQEKLDTLKSTPLLLRYTRVENSEGPAAFFRDRLKDELELLLSQHRKPDGIPYNLYTDGLKIYTTLHSRLQQYAEEAAKNQLKRIQPLLDRDLQRSNFFVQNNDLLVSELKKSTHYKHLEKQGLPYNQILTLLQKKDSIQISTLWGEKNLFISPVDSLRLILSSLQAGMLVVSPSNGAVLAWVGGSNYKQAQYDHVTAQRQAGSVFKPIVYAQALRDGVKPCDFFPNQKITYTQYENWTPENSGEKENGRYSMAGALANSVNTISVQLCMKSGIQNVISLAHELGIKSTLPSKPSIALGTADMSLWELTGAYTAFANNGTRSTLQFITNVLNDQGEKILEIKPVYATILTEKQAHQMTNMLGDVVDKGTAHELRTVYGLKGNIAGKTGTTQDNKDGWFMGYTSGFLAGVWVGADNPAIHFSGMTQGRGAATAMPIWADFYKQIKKDPELQYLVIKPFPFTNDLDCEMYKDDTFLQKLFQRKSRTDHKTGLEENGRTKKRKERNKQR